jgi:hypothetical protein
MAGGAIYAQKADVEAQAIIIPPCKGAKSLKFLVEKFLKSKLKWQ